MLNILNSSFLVSCFFCVCTCFLISCKSIGNLCWISWRSHSLKKWVQIMMISPVYILCIICNYPPKGRWIVVDIYWDAKRQSLFLALWTDPVGDNCILFTKCRLLKQCRFLSLNLKQYKQLLKQEANLMHQDLLIHSYPMVTVFNTWILLF